MMKYSEPLPSTSLHSSEDFQNSSTDDSQPLAPTPQDAKISLTSLWEYVVRTNGLPENLDLDAFFALISQRLRNPEWEVRQHALRVLVDFIPLINKTDLDIKLQTILNDIVANLGHVGPAVRKGAVDALKVYINASSKSGDILHELIETGIAGAHDNKIASNVTLGIIVAVPFLITPKITHETLRYIIDILLSKLNQAPHHESVLRALIRIKGIVGVDRFENILKLHKSRREFEMLSDLYNIPEPNPSDLIADTFCASDNKQFWSDYNQNIVSSGSFENCTNSENGNENGSCTKDSEEVVEDKVILETEIKLDSGSAITMKIHEESRMNAANEGVDSDDESRGIRTFKVLADDSEDEYELLRRTPRRVRFGGEIVKMRTPDSDSNHPSDEDPTITITPNQTKPSIEIQYANTGAKLRTSKSHIPVPVLYKNKATQSEPNSPKRNVNASMRYLYRSSPNLSRNHEVFGQRINQKSRIPRLNEIDKKEVKCERSIRIQVNERKTFKNLPVDEKDRIKAKPVRQQAQEKLPTIQKSVSQRNESAQEKLPTIQKSMTQRNDNTEERFLSIKRSRSPQAIKKNLNEEIPVPNFQNTRKLLSPSMYSMQKVDEGQGACNKQRTAHKEQKATSTIPALEFHPQKSQQGSTTKEVEMLHNLETKDKARKPKEFKTQLIPSTARRNSREQDQYSPIPIHNEIEVLHNLTRSPERKQLVNHRDEEATELEGSRHLTTADGVLFTNETLPRITSGRKIHTADVVRSECVRNGTTNQLVFINNYNSFHVYNSPGTNRYVQDLNDSPIPTMDNGECLTCSSSESDVVVLDGNKSDNMGLLDERILKDIQCKDDIRTKQRGLEELLKVLHDPSVMKSVEERFSFLLNILFSAEQLPLLQSTAEQILTYTFSNAREQTLTGRLQQIGLSLSKIGSPVGVRLALIILKRIPPRCLIDHLLSDSILGAKSSKVREGALQILMSVSRIFPSTEMDIPKCVKPVLRALQDRKRKVRQAALETLAALTQLSSTSIVLDVVSRIIEDYSDREQILRVIRTRLSRKQLPAVDINGNVRYSTPCGESEVEWISRGSGSPQSGRESRFHEREENISEENIVDSSYEQLSAGQRVNYWKENLRHRVVENSDEGCTEEIESIFSRDSKEDTSNKINNTQIWAIDPTVFTTSEKLTSINGTLRPLFVIQTNEERSRNNVKSHQGRRTKVNKETNTGINYNTHQRGRSFSPPKRSVDTSEENDRFIRESDGPRRHPRLFKDERFHKSFSSDQLLSNDSKIRQHISSSSGSSTSTSGSSLRNGVWSKDVRSGIPIPICSDGRLKFRTRNAEPIKGPVISSPFYIREFVMSKTNNLWGLREDCKDNYWKMFQCCVCKSRSRKIADSALQASSTPVVEVAIIPYENDTSKPLSPNETIEKFSSPPRPVMARQPFSSGSESSGYFTPPAEPHMPTQDLAAEEIRQSSGQPERFIKIDTPMHHQENFTIIDSNYCENIKRSSPVSSTKSEHIDDSFVDFRDSTEDNFDSKSSAVENFNCNNYVEESYVKEEENETELRRDVSLTSLDELDFVADRAFGEKRNLSKSEANIQVSPDLTRKTVNSAPMLNEVNFTNFEKLDETPLSSTKTSLPGSVVDFHEIEVVQEIIKKSPTKTICKKTITRQMSRKRSCRMAKSETGIFSEALQPFTKTKEAFQETMAQMESSEWEMNMKGLEGMVRLIRYHKDVVELHMHTVCVALAKHIRNLRSQVARTACLTASELLKTCKKTIEPDLEELASALLHRTADTNKFLRSDANTALDDMCTYVSTPRVVMLLTTRGCGHQNAIVRCAAARLLCAIIHRLGPEKFFLLPKDTRDKVLLSGANMLMEGSLETRKHAKMMFGLLSNHSQFHRALMDTVPSTVMRHIEKSLKSLT